MTPRNLIVPMGRGNLEEKSPKVAHVNIFNSTVLSQQLFLKCEHSRGTGASNSRIRSSMYETVSTLRQPSKSPCTPAMTWPVPRGNPVEYLSILERENLLLWHITPSPECHDIGRVQSRVQVRAGTLLY